MWVAIRETRRTFYGLRYEFMVVQGFRLCLKVVHALYRASPS